MTPGSRRSRWPLLLTLALGACGGAETETVAGPIDPISARLIPAPVLRDAVAQSEARPRRQAAVCLAKASGIDFLRLGAVGARDLAQLLHGDEAEVEIDLDGDGKAEQVYAFSPDADADTYLTWRIADTCALAWGSKGVFWQVVAPCQDKAAAVVCMQDLTDGSASCDRCDDTACHACETQGLGVDCW